MSHPCGAHFGVPHGVANAINLPHVIRFNAAGGSDIADRYRDVNELLGLEVGRRRDEAVGDALAAHVHRARGPARPAHAAVRGRACRRTASRSLVEGAMGDGTTLMNPREPVRGGLRAAATATRSRRAPARRPPIPRGGRRSSAFSVERGGVLGLPAELRCARSVRISTGLRADWIQATGSGRRGIRVSTSTVASTARFGHGTEYQPSASATSRA